MVQIPEIVSPEHTHLHYTAVCYTRSIWMHAKPDFRAVCCAGHAHVSGTPATLSHPWTSWLLLSAPGRSRAPTGGTHGIPQHTARPHMGRPWRTLRPHPTSAHAGESRSPTCRVTPGGGAADRSFIVCGRVTALGLACTLQDTPVHPLLKVALPCTIQEPIDRCRLPGCILPGCLLAWGTPTWPRRPCGLLTLPWGCHLSSSQTRLRLSIGRRSIPGNRPHSARST